MTVDAVSRLREVPLFAGMADAHLELLAARTSHEHLEAGAWLFHEGDSGDSLFLVTAGSLDVVVEHPSPVVIRTVRRGEAVGELAILTDAPRSTGVRAHRDAELIRLERADVEALLNAEPSFGAALTRILAHRLQSNRVPTTQHLTPPGTIAVIPLGRRAGLAEIATQLTTALEQLGTVARVDGPEPTSLETLDRLEQAHDRVLLVATDPDPANVWTAYCLRQADRVVALASGEAPTQARPVDSRLEGCDLALHVPEGVEPPARGWMDILQPRTTHILRRGQTVGVERMARRLSGRSLGVVLSGGGSRGFAHVGVIEELQTQGYAVDRIGGASMGAMVGSLFAESRTPDEVAAVLEAVYINDSPLAGKTLPLVALSRGERGFATQVRLHADRYIEGLDVNFFCVSADLAAQRQVIHRSGLVALAVSASQALPAFVPPVQDGERILVDGAVLNNLPVEPMMAMGEGPVIAVDVSGRLPPPRAPKSRIPDAIRRWIVGPAVDWAPMITETVLRSILLGNAATDAAARASADMVISPSLHGMSVMRFTDVEAPRNSGRLAVREAVEAGRLEAAGIRPVR